MIGPEQNFPRDFQPDRRAVRSLFIETQLPRNRFAYLELTESARVSGLRQDMLIPCRGAARIHIAFQPDQFMTACFENKPSYLPKAISPQSYLAQTAKGLLENGEQVAADIDWEQKGAFDIRFPGEPRTTTFQVVRSDKPVFNQFHQAGGPFFHHSFVATQPTSSHEQSRIVSQKRPQPKAQKASASPRVQQRSVLEFLRTAPLEKLSPLGCPWTYAALMHGRPEQIRRTITKDGHLDIRRVGSDGRPIAKLVQAGRQLLWRRIDSESASS
jgi:hypothetical protein